MRFILVLLTKQIKEFPTPTEAAVVGVGNSYHLFSLDLSTSIMNFIRNRNFRAGPQTSLEGFICHQNSDKQQKIKVFGRSEGR